VKEVLDHPQFACGAQKPVKDGLHPNRCHGKGEITKKPASTHWASRPLGGIGASVNISISADLSAA